MLNKSNAHELAQISAETGALVFRGQLGYPGPVHSRQTGRTQSASLQDAGAKTEIGE